MEERKKEREKRRRKRGRKKTRTITSKYSRFYESLDGSAKTEKAEELFKLIYLRFSHLEIDKVVFQNNH